MFKAQLITFTLLGVAYTQFQDFDDMPNQFDQQAPDQVQQARQRVQNGTRLSEVACVNQLIQNSTEKAREALKSRNLTELLANCEGLERIRGSPYEKAVGNCVILESRDNALICAACEKGFEVGKDCKLWFGNATAESKPCNLCSNKTSGDKDNKQNDKKNNNSASSVGIYSALLAGQAAALSFLFL